MIQHEDDRTFSKYYKALRQHSQKFWPKILTPYLFYSNLYLHFLRPCREKIVCIVSEKIGKSIPQFDIVFLASILSCLQFQWNKKYFSSAVLRLHGWLLVAPWHGFCLLDRERWIQLIPLRVQRISPWLANLSSLSGALRLLLKIFCQGNKFFYLKSIASFRTSVCPEIFQIFCYCNDLVSLSSKVFNARNFINFVTSVLLAWLSMLEINSI